MATATTTEEFLRNYFAQRHPGAAPGTPAPDKSVPIDRAKRPEDEEPDISFERNKRWAKPGPYTTKLTPQEEKKFQQWVKQNKVPWQDTANADYDMRGYYRALSQGKIKPNTSVDKNDGTIHYTDTYKTPYDATFSRESQYATKDAPYWVGDKLVGADGQTIVDPAWKPKQNTGDYLKNYFSQQSQPGRGPSGLRRDLEKFPAFKETEDAIGSQLYAASGVLQNLNSERKYLFGHTDAAGAKHMGEFQRVLKNFRESEDWKNLNSPSGDYQKDRQYIKKRQREDAEYAKKHGVPAQAFQGLTEGIGDVVAGAMSPAQLMLLLGTGGASIGEDVGVQSLRAFTASHALHSLMGLGFSAQMLSDVKPALEQSEAKFKAGDVIGGVQDGTSAVVSAVFGLLGIAHAGVSGFEVRGEWKNEAEVRNALEAGAISQYGKKWINLKPEEKTHVVYNAIEEYGPQSAKRFQRAMMGVEPPEPGVEKDLDRRVKESIEELAWRRKANEVIMAALEQERQDWHEMAADAQQRFEAKVRRELDAIPTPTKRAAQEPPIVLDTPQQPQTPEERADVAYETRKEEVTRQIEADRALDAQRTEKEEQQRQDVEKRRAEQAEQEKRTRPFTVVDKRAVSREQFVRSRIQQAFDELARERKAREAFMAGLPPNLPRFSGTGNLEEDLRRKSKIRQEMDAIPAPTKRAMEDPPIVIDAPTQPQTPEEREQAAYETRKEEATRLLEAERALEAQRVEQEEQQRQDLEKRRAEEEERNRGFTVVDRRAVPLDEVTQELNDQIATQVVPQSPATRYFKMMDDLVRDHARSLYPDSNAEPGVIYERLRKKREQGESLNEQEQVFMRAYAYRERAARNLIDPKIRSHAAELINQLDRDRVQRIIQLASRETALYRAAKTFQRWAMSATGLDEADLAATQATEAQELAEKLRTQREQEQAARKAAEEPEPVVEHKAPVNAISGAATTIALPDGRHLKARYGAVRLSRLIISHDPRSFEWNPKFVPRGMQPRDLSTNEEAANAIRESGKEGVYESNRYTSDDPTSQNGPAVILPDGRVAGGNSRLLRLLRALDTSAREAIVNDLQRSLAKFGIEYEEAPDYSDPLVPVRILDDFPEETEALIRLGQDLNRDHMMGFSPAEQAVMAGQRLKLEDVERIGKWMVEVDSDNPSLSKVLAARGQKIFDLMVQRGVIPENKRAAYMVNGQLTEDAKLEFERMILGSVIDDAEILATTPKSTLNKVERSLAALVKIRSAHLADWNFIDYLKDALVAWRQIDSIREELNNLGEKTDSLVDRYYRPQDFKMGTATLNFSEGELRPKPHPTTYALVRLLEADAAKVNEAFSKYADEVEGRQGSLLPPMKPVDAFNRFIGEKVGVEVSEMEWGKSSPATEEAKKAYEDGKKNPQKATPAQKKAQKDQPINPLPGMQHATDVLQGQAEQGTVTPESMREFFSANPVIARSADDLMKIFGKIIPNSFGWRLDDFIKEAFTKLEQGGEGPLGPGGGRAKGAYDRATKVLTLYNGADVSTVVHEWFHAMRPYLKANDMQVLEDWAHGELAKVGIASTPGLWGRDKEELTARALEQYMTTGKAPTPEVKGVFERLRDAFRQIYYVIAKKKLPEKSPLKVHLAEGGQEVKFNISPEVRATFDRWFGKERQQESAGKGTEGTKPTSYTDKSVRDFPVRATLNGDKVTVTTSVARNKLSTITVDRADWPTEKGLWKGKRLGNPRYQQRQLVRELLAATKAWDFNADGAAHAERIADAHVTAINKVLEGEPTQQMAAPPAPANTGQQISKVLARIEKRDHFWVPISELREAMPGIKDEDIWQAIRDGYLVQGKYDGPTGPGFDTSEYLQSPDNPDDFFIAVLRTRQLEFSKRGDFYTLTGDEAPAVAKLLGLTLQRTKETGEPEVSIAAHASDKLFKELEQSGYKVEKNGAKNEELAPPPSSIETAITPEERDSLIVAGYFPKHYNEVEGTPRLKRFKDKQAAEDWARLNFKDAQGNLKIKGMTLWTTPDGKAVMMFVPRDEQTLFQMEPPPSTEPGKENSPEFKKWFGDSKVVDEDGNPKVVYHGTAGNFESFDASRSGRASGHPTASLGFFFTESPEVSNLFAGTFDDTDWPPRFKYRQGANTLPVYLSISNPFEMTADQWRKIVLDNGATGETSFAEKAKQYLAKQKDLLLKQGYDGIHILGDPKYRDSMTEEYGHDNWVAFRSEQVKSAIGNRGTFDPADPSILFQMGPPPPTELQRTLDRIAELRKMMAEAPVFQRGKIQRDIAALEARTNLPRSVLDTMWSTPPPPSASAIINVTRPPELRNPATPGQAILLFPGTDLKEPPRAETKPGSSVRPGEVPDEGAGVRPPERPGGVAEPAARPAGDAANATRGDAGRGRPGGSAAGPARRKREREPDLENVRPVAIAPPTRMRGQSLVAAEPWRKRMADLLMPVDLKPPTVKLAAWIAAVLKFPGQVEAAEVVATALEQHDGAVIANSTGTGKTFISWAVGRHLELEHGAKRGLVVTVNRKSVKGSWKAVGKKFFGVDVRDLPKKVSQLKDGRYVTTYDQLLKRKDFANYNWDYVIFDESDAARRWYDQETQKGETVRKLSDASKKAIYVSATPFHEALEYGYMTKLGLWEPGKFDEWVSQFGARKSKDGKTWADHGANPKMLVELRKQLIDRDQFVSQEKSFEGYTAQFAMVPMTAETRAGLQSANDAFAETERRFTMQGKTASAATARRIAATFKKTYLERRRLPEVIELIKQGKKLGWQIAIISDTDKGREEVYNFMKKADTDGRLSELLPKFDGVYDTLAKELGQENVANYSGKYSAKREAELDAWMAGKKDFLFTTYAAGGRAVSMHDTSPNGTRPRLAIYIGPPYSGTVFEQALGRFWRYGATSNVHAVFLTSDALPEVNMLATKIAPRLGALRAAVNGIAEDDEMVKRLRGLESTRTEAAHFELGGAIEFDQGDWLPANEHIPIDNWKQVQLPSAERAKHKGMKYPGQVSKPGVIEPMKLFQEDGGPGTPERFLSPEEDQARLQNEEVMQAFADGEAVPGLTQEEVQSIDPGSRVQMADGVGANVAALIEQAVQNEQDPMAAANNGFRTGMLEVLAAQRAGQVEALADAGEGQPEWEMRQTRGPNDPAPTPPPVQHERPVSAHYYWMSGRKNILSVTRQAGVPEVGQRIVRDIKEYQAQQAMYAGQFTGEYLKILRDNKITDKEHRLMVMAKEGKVPPANARIARGVQQTTELLNRIRQMAAEKNIYIEDYDEAGVKKQVPYADILDNPHYYPHIHDYRKKIRLKDPQTGQEHVFTLEQLLGGKLSDIKRGRIIASIEAATGKTKAEIERFLANRMRRTPVGGNIERSRGVDLQFYRMDQGAMIQYFDSVGEVFARSDIFGQGREKLDGLVAQIPNQKALKIVNNIMDQLLKPRRWDEETGKLYSRIAAAEIISKMVFSPIKVPFHLAHSTVVLEQITPVIRGIFYTATHWREALENATFTGALVEQTKAQQLLEQGTDLRVANQYLSGTGFNWMYKFTRTANNAAGQIFMEDALRKLIKGEKYRIEQRQKGKTGPIRVRADHLREILRDRFLLTDEQINQAIENKRWTQEDLRKGAVAFVQKTMFTGDPTELPPWWRGRSDDPVYDNLLMAVRMTTILKSFTFKTSALLKEMLIDELRRGNFAPWIPFLVAYPAAGAAIKLAGAGMSTVFQEGLSLASKGTPLPATPLGKQLADLEDLFDDPSIAKIVHHYMDWVGSATAMEMLTHIFDVVFFPNKNKRIAQYQLQQLKFDIAKDFAGGAYTDLWETLDLLFDMAGTANIEEGEKKWKKEGKLIRNYAREASPLVRSMLPPDTKHTYQMAPPP